MTYLAHDIKTPLSNLLGYLTLLNDEDNLTREQQKKFIKIILKNVKILNDLSKDFFSYLKFNLNEIPLNIVKVNIEVFFKQWEEERKTLIKNNIIVIDFVNTSNKEIKIDPELLLRIIDNLISNANKYAKKGTDINVTVMISNKKLMINISNEIEDNVNIDWNLVKLKFYRGDISRNHMINNGSGLGLTIVNDIIKHLDGKFEIVVKDNKVFAEIILPI
ncbi:MAG: HAMP domain-containing histidine kinase [Clostridioides sp.]|nr:HAMP domain-containing histidine kinase [Clostridioides sp.]